MNPDSTSNPQPSTSASAPDDRVAVKRPVIEKTRLAAAQALAALAASKARAAPQAITAAATRSLIAHAFGIPDPIDYKSGASPPHPSVTLEQVLAARARIIDEC